MTLTTKNMTFRSGAGVADQPFRASRLTLARQRRGLTKADLAAASGLSVTSISAYEREKTTPEPENVQKLAATLNFPAAFFYDDEASLVDASAVSFRALSKMSARQRDQVTATASVATQLDQWIGRSFELPAPDVPDLPGEDPVVAADAVRESWGLGSRPISNSIHLLEAHGVRVYSLWHPGWGADSRYVNGLSMWWEGRPYIFVNTDNNGERGRLTALHELGHLVLHRHGAPRGQGAEKEANRFAGAFLIAAADLHANARRSVTLRTIIHDKRRWGASAAALVYRLHEEGLIEYWEYRDLNIRLRTQYGSNEPNSIGRQETSQVLGKVFSALREDGKNRTRIADELRVHVEDLDCVIFSHVPTPVTGQGIGAGATGPAGGTRDQIKVLK